MTPDQRQREIRALKATFLDALSAAAALVERIERDGEWRVADSVLVVDAEGNVVVSVDGWMRSPQEDEETARDIVDARRLLPLLLARLDRVEAENARLTRDLADARSYGDEMAKIGGRRG